ncbi:MAG: NAD(+) synthase [Pseudomonadota bacterium]|nr:NAD(+) synthase [Pseudomonadota bacterium]
MPAGRFHSIYSHGFVRVAVCVPHVRVADPVFNTDRTLALARQAADRDAAVVLFPELGISAYSNQDLFQQDALLDACIEQLERLRAASETLRPLLLVGAPLRFEGKLFNCAVVIHRGRLLGIVPKSYLPNYREFYEKRQFSPARVAVEPQVRLLGEEVAFGNHLIFEATDIAGLALHVEICEDLWAPVPPSTYAALAGATVLANLSASNITVAKAEYRRDLCAAQSGKCVAAYLYSAAGPGESTTDLAWDGHALIYENNDLLCESERFSPDEQVICADVDLERLAQDRMRLTTFSDATGDHLPQLRRLRRIPFTLAPADADIPLERAIERFPFVPDAPGVRDARCYEAYNIQVHGLAKRLAATGIDKVVIGVSGGLDSTHALIVAARTMDRLGLPRSHILGYTMPAFATSEKTRGNAHQLMKHLGITAREIDITPSAKQMLADIGHPYARGEAVYDVNFENVQAGERTSHLFRLAQQNHALVLGTGDLSEIALGWMTYGVGDHMSHYAVNASVPKTLIQHLIRWVIDAGEFGAETNAVLQDILDTEISPELVPADAQEADGEGPAQSTEARIGPYALQDFNIYYVTRYGFRPSKVAFLAYSAWHDASRGRWPAGLPETDRRAYTLAEIKHWLGVFVWRFFKISQFKRSALPDGPKVGSGGSLSPRGDWRAPSDGEAVVWQAELARIPDEEPAGATPPD